MNYHHNPINTAYSTSDPFHPENDIIRSTSNLQQDLFLFTFPNSPQTMPHLEYNYNDGDDDDHLQFLDLFCQHQSLNTTAHKQEFITTTLAADNMPEYSNQEKEKEEEEEEEIHHHQLPPSSTTTVVTISKKKKKDRHSKIETARGPRDRRMRLSLEVARKFFDLQDVLGYDKASSTVEWLLRNSASAIRELSDNYNNLIMMGGANSTTTAASSVNTCEEEVVSSSKKEKKHPQPKKTTKKIRSTVPTEARRKARERARERTSQKRRLISSTTETTLPIIAETCVVQELSSGYRNNIDVFSDHQNQQIAEFQFWPWEAYNSSNNNLCG